MIMDLATVILLFLTLYVLQAIVILAGLKRLPQATGHAQPRVSIVIAARNEEHSIARCINSACAQTYSMSSYEVIVVDDDSTDMTGEIIRQHVERYGHLRSVRTDSKSALRGKARALAAGIEAASGEIILVTDADCRVPPTWVEETVRYFASDVGLVGGMTLQDATTPFGGVQSLDWAYLLGIAASSVALGGSFGCIGNNLAFRKKAYEAVGGYSSLPFSVTEDYTLVRAIRKTGAWKHVSPIDPRVLVESEPCRDVASLFRQKHRWGRGGLDVPLLGFLIMAIGWGVHVLPIVHTVAWGAWAHTLTVMLVKATADYALISAVLHRLGRTNDLRYFVHFQIYFALYVLMLPFIVVAAGPVRWKGRTY